MVSFTFPLSLPPLNQFSVNIQSETVLEAGISTHAQEGHCLVGESEIILRHHRNNIHHHRTLSTLVIVQILEQNFQLGYRIIQ
jgi:hypothetical protein